VFQFLENAATGKPEAPGGDARHPPPTGRRSWPALSPRGCCVRTYAVEAPWTDIGTVARQLLDRPFAGKAVLLPEPEQCLVIIAIAFRTN
jgi:hypothetical protein